MLWRAHQQGIKQWAGGAHVVRDTSVLLRAGMGEEKTPWGSPVGWVGGWGPRGSCRGKLDGGREERYVVQGREDQGREVMGSAGILFLSLDAMLACQWDSAVYTGQGRERGKQKRGLGLGSVQIQNGRGRSEKSGMDSLINPKG